MSTNDQTHITVNRFHDRSEVIDQHATPLSIKRSAGQCLAQVVFATVILVVIVALAHLLGMKTTVSQCGTVVLVSTLAGLALLMAGAVHSRKYRAEGLPLTIACCLPAYAGIVIVFFDPNWFIYDRSAVLRSIAFLVPVLIGAVNFFFRRLWISAGGAWLVLFAWIAALSYNTSHVHTGIGFWAAWAD